MCPIKNYEKKKENFSTRFTNIFAERLFIYDFREIGVLIRFEFKRIILTLKFFIALSLVLLPAIIFLDSIAQNYEALLLDIGIEEFQKFSASGFVIIGQFIVQLIAIMLTLDSFGKSTDESMRRYFALPIRKINIYIAHTLNILIGIIFTSLLSIIIFDLILWIWTGVSLSFILIVKAFFMIIIGALLASLITSLFIAIANWFNFSSSIAIIPTLFLFYIIPFLVYFITLIVYSVPLASKWTFIYQIEVATSFIIQPHNGLQKILEPIANQNAWLIISLVGGLSGIITAIIFTTTEK